MAHLMLWEQSFPIDSIHRRSAKEHSMQDATDNTVNGNSRVPSNGECVTSRHHGRMSLHLVVTDPDVCSELRCHETDDERNQYALAALKIGVHAMRQASGVIDATSVRDEVSEMLHSLREVLGEHAAQCTGGISSSLKGFFDPESGQLTQRLNRLVKRDGELDELLSRHLGDDTSTVAQTLASHVGEQSPLFKMLSPEQANGLLASLRDAVLRKAFAGEL